MQEDFYNNLLEFKNSSMNKNKLNYKKKPYYIHKIA